MASGKAEVSIERSPDDVWKVVRDFGGLADYMPGIESCTVDGDVRTIGMMGIEVKEQLRDLDDDTRRITYGIIESPMGNLVSHLVRHRRRRRRRRHAPHVDGRGRARRPARALPARLRGLGRRAEATLRELTRSGAAGNVRRRPRPALVHLAP